MGLEVLGFDEIDRSMVALVGGKGAQLAELARIDGIRVPAGFCVTTEPFERVARQTAIADGMERLSMVEPGDRASIESLGADIRRRLETVEISGDLAREVDTELDRLGASDAYAVRSSGTAEDLPSASFAGQHDTFLDVEGTAAILDHVRRCWASLFTDRAISYRIRNGIDHRMVRMAVVVQRMVAARASGVLFTADPLTGNRRVATVEAVRGLGEALVSGLVTPHVYRVRDGEIVDRTVDSVGSSIEPALTDGEVARLAGLGRSIEAHFGRPQDIEWRLADGEFQFVQSRPITTLFPIPEAGDTENHVYLSVGHNQMMTDAMKPLGLSFWQMTTPRPMAEAGSRLFVDVTRALASPAGRAGLLDTARKSDPLTADALQTVLEREGFIEAANDEDAPGRPAATRARDDEAGAVPTDPAIVEELIREAQASIANARREIATKQGSALLDFILADIVELRRVLFDPRSHGVFMSAMEASWWLNDHLEQWLGEKNVADILSQSVSNNVTSEMGLALLAVADVIRPHPSVVAFLGGTDGDDFLDELPKFPGGREARDAIAAFLDRYGMRCSGEIDITRPRWSERPRTLLPLILANVRNFEPGEAERRFDGGRREAEAKEHDVLRRLAGLPDGERKAREAKARIDRVRTFIGYREYPKYAMVSRYLVYKRALLAEAARLVERGQIREPEDIFVLRFEELADIVPSGRVVDDGLIRERKAAFAADEALTPPRVLTSDGESINGSYRRDDLPDGALVGLPVSAGTVEGRARVIHDLADAVLEPGDILVTAYTDPSWTPLFLGIGGLVTEVGGTMTHGAVIAREYGLPAVVAVDGATERIRDGQRIRVDGTNGFIEMLA